MLIELAPYYPYEKKIFISTAHVEAIIRVKYGDGPEGTLVYAGTHCFTVKETPEEIIEKLK